MDLYAENILDHYRHPRHKEPLKGATVAHKEENISCGDELAVELTLKNGMIENIGWSRTGCAISQAGMSMLSEELIGKTSTEAAAMTQQNIYEMFSVPIGPRRFKCALLCLHTLKNALNIAAGKKPQSWTKTVQIDNG